MKIVNTFNSLTLTFCTLFFFSGFSSLILEILWQRKLVLTFGASAPATTAVLAAFFIGLAFGSLFAGKMLGSAKNPVRFYALTELWIGCWALSFPLLLLLADKIYLKTFAYWQGSAVAFPIRFSLVILTILPATLGMGATIPAMNQILRNYFNNTGKAVSLAYGINTLGAVFGTCMSGFILLRYLGINNTLYLAITINFVVFISSIIISKSAARKSPLEKYSTDTIPAATNEDKKAAQYRLILTVCYFFSGFFALAFEITWLRMLAIFNTDSIVTITLAFSIYLFGYSLGSIVIFPLLSKRFNAHKIYFLANLGIVIAIMLALPVIYRIPLRNFDYYTIPAKTFFNLVMHEGITTIIILFLPTVFLGLAYPAVCQAVASSRVRIAKISGFLYTSGNIGSVTGVLVTGFFLIPHFGIVKTIALLCIAVSCISLLLLWFDENRLRRSALAVIPVIFITLSIGYYVKGLPFLRLKKIYENNGQLTARYDEKPFKKVKILEYKEGLHATVIITEDPAKNNNRGLFIDDLNVASENQAALLDAKVLAHIPLLLHPDPKSALTIGFGSGATSNSMITYGISVFAVEIEKEVMKGAHLFKKINNNVMAHPNFKLVIDDARNYLRITRQKFDVISNDLTRVQYKQNASLYTKENFELIKSCLTEQGICCAFIPYHQLSTSDLKILMRTFCSVFPHSSLWIVDHIHGNYMMVFIGLIEDLKIDIRKLKSLLTRSSIQRDLASVGIEHPYQIVNYLYLDNAGFRQYIGTGPLHTDNHPILEFTSPKSFDRPETTAESLKQIAELRPKDYSPVLDNLPDAERTMLKNFYHFSQLINPLSRSLYPSLLKESRPRETPFSSLVEQITLYEEALRIFPDYRWGQSRLKALKVQFAVILQKYLEKKGRTPSQL